MATAKMYEEVLKNWVNAAKLLANTVTDDENGNTYVLSETKKIHCTGLIPMCNALHINYTRIDWQGNKQCDTNWDEISFTFDDIKFFELVSKEESKNEDR